MFLGIYDGPKLNDTEMPKSKIKANTNPKIVTAQHEPNMVPAWPKVAQDKKPIWSQLGPKYTEMVQHEPNMALT